MKTFKLKLIVVCALLPIFAVAPTVLADWNEGDSYKMHYPQLPDPCGWDVCLEDQWLADDFTCTESGAITDIHFWISWLDDVEGDPYTTWDISIWNDAGCCDDRACEGAPSRFIDTSDEAVSFVTRLSFYNQ